VESTTAPQDTQAGRPAAEGTAVAAKDVTRTYGSGETAVEALRGVSLDVAHGELVSIMGPSGSGKSTLMHIMAGLDKPTSGEVEIAGKAVSKLNDTELTKLRRKNVGFVFQFFNLLPMLTAEENVTLPLQLAGGKLDKGWVADVIERVGLSDRKTHRPAELSGGQQQRVAIARALVSRPTVVFADEPTGNLDSKSGNEILAVLREAVQEYGQTTVMVTHDPGAACIADRTLFIADGLIVRQMQQANPHDLLGVLEEITTR
jgi:putative ABC transport system ATP-binding protein